MHPTWPRCHREWLGSSNWQTRPFTLLVSQCLCDPPSEEPSLWPAGWAGSGRAVLTDPTACGSPTRRGGRDDRLGVSSAYPAPTCPPCRVWAELATPCGSHGCRHASRCRRLPHPRHCTHGLSFPGIRVHSLSHSEVTDKPSLHRHLEHKPSLGIRPPKKAEGLFHTEPYQFLQGPI